MNVTVAPPRSRRSAPTKLSRWARPLVAASLAVVTIVVLAVYVFPTRTWLDQRADRAVAQTELDALRAERTELAERVAALDTDEEIEKIARGEYGLVRPGEEAYATLPAAAPAARTADVFPFGDLFAVAGERP